MNAPIPDRQPEAIAIIGMAGRFPHSPDLETFWQNLQAGRELITFFTPEELLAEGLNPELVRRPEYVPARAVLEQAEYFDAAFFGYTPREAEAIDPQQRQFLECAWAALENAGYDPERCPGEVGVFGSQSTNTYVLWNLLSNPALAQALGDYQLMISSEKDYLTTRVSYKLGLHGPSVNVQTACSSSLVAVVMACQSLLGCHCDLALAGGVSISSPRKEGHLYQPGMLLSPDGHCRTFDAGARGLVNGEGVGVVVLKRLSEALAEGDQVLAVIKGAAINNDGGRKAGFTAPSLNGQAEVVAAAQALAQVPAETITFLEAHGTGTELGDPIEVAALTEAFRLSTGRTGYCAIGSLEPNTGHMDAAAGVASLIKTVLALQHRQIPPTLNFERPNPLIDFAATPFYVNTTLSEWKPPDGPRRAGVSSFGIGGTNAHVVLEEAPPAPTPPAGRPVQLLLLSARSEAALAAASERLAQRLRACDPAGLADAAYTLALGRKPFPYRRAVIAGTGLEAAAALEQGLGLHGLAAGGGAPVTFVCSHPAAGWNAALDRAEPAYRAAFDHCAALAQETLGLDLRAPEGAASGPAAGGPAAEGPAAEGPARLASAWALAQLWKAWGVRPAALMGEGLGELAAACLAGVFSLADALRLAAEPQAEARARMAAGLAHPESGLPLLASLTGAGLAPEQAPKRELDPAGWSASWRSPDDEAVRQRLAQDSGALLLALDPGVEPSGLLVQLARLWLAGVEIDWAGFYAGQARRRVALPSYPFERQAYWIQPGPNPGLLNLGNARPAPGTPPRPGEPDGGLTRLTWQRTAPCLPEAKPGPWLVLGDLDGPAASLIERLQQAGTPVVTVTPGEPFQFRPDGTCQVRAERAGDYAALLAHLAQTGQAPRQIVHAWCLPAFAPETPALARLEAAERLGTAALQALAQALAAARPPQPDGLELAVLTSGAAEVSGDEPLEPARALLLGVVDGLAQEFPQLGVRLVDLALDADGRLDEAQAGLALAELLSRGRPRLVARRGRHGWEPAAAPLALPEPPDGPGLGAASVVCQDRASEGRASEGRASEGRAGSLRFVRLGGGVEGPFPALEVDLGAPGAIRAAAAQAEALLGRVSGAIYTAPTVEKAAARQALAVLQALQAPDGPRLDFIALSCGQSGTPVEAGAIRAYLEALAAAANRAGGNPVVSISAPFEAGEMADLARLLAQLAACGLAQVRLPGPGRPSPAQPAPQAPPLAAPRPPEPASLEHRYPRPELAAPYTAPSGPVQTEIAAIWSALLGVAPVGIYDNFFELGGHSLLATQLMARVNQAYGVDLPMRVIFEGSTVAGIAERVEALQWARDNQSGPPGPGEDDREELEF